MSNLKTVYWVSGLMSTAVLVLTYLCPSITGTWGTPADWIASIGAVLAIIVALHMAQQEKVRKPHFNFFLELNPPKTTPYSSGGQQVLGESKQAEVQFEFTVKLANSGDSVLARIYQGETEDELQRSSFEPRYIIAKGDSIETLVTNQLCSGW